MSLLSRQLADHTPIPATPNTLSLPAAAPPYIRSATVDGRPANLPAGTGSFGYGAATQGLIERLVIGIGETFAEWSQRLFGTLVSQTADADGRTNYEEYLAGTDLKVASSAFRARIAPADAGLIIIWQSVSGKTCAVERTTDLNQPFTVLEANLTATSPENSFKDSTANGMGSYFCRIRTNE